MGYGTRFVELAIEGEKRGGCGSCSQWFLWLAREGQRRSDGDEIDDE